MDASAQKVLAIIGITDSSELNGLLISRDVLLSVDKYNEAKLLLPQLKLVFSSSSMTSLQSDAAIVQKFPLLNLVRQILHVYNYTMIPIRKSDGYTADGIKKYKRFFQIEQIKLKVK